MTYSFQTFVASQVLTAGQMNQVEANIRDHTHGADGVSALEFTRVLLRDFGDDSDGSLTVNSNQNLISGEHNFTTLQVNSGKTLTIIQSYGASLANGAEAVACVLRCSSKATIDGTITVQGLGMPGGAGGAPTIDGSIGAYGSFAGVGGGGGGGTGVNGVGGAGGDNTDLPGPAGGGTGGGVGSASSLVQRTQLKAAALNSSFYFIRSGAGGGGGGGGGSGAASGGEGGRGGGILVIIAPVISFTGTLDARGAPGGGGGTESAGNAGGGGGGGGGGVIITASGSYSVNTGGRAVSGGTGGGGGSGGGSGGAGGAGWQATITL